MRSNYWDIAGGRKEGGGDRYILLSKYEGIHGGKVEEEKRRKRKEVKRRQVYGIHRWGKKYPSKESTDYIPKYTLASEVRTVGHETC